MPSILKCDCGAHAEFRVSWKGGTEWRYCCDDNACIGRAVKRGQVPVTIVLAVPSDRA